MGPPEQELERRRPVWDALSSFFLDAELDDESRQQIVQTIVASGYTPSEIQTILWEEVYPVVRLNLCSPAGVWDSFDLDWLQEQILSGKHKRRAVRKRTSDTRLAKTFSLGPAPAVRKEWEELLLFLPKRFRDKTGGA